MDNKLATSKNEKRADELNKLWLKWYEEMLLWRRFEEKAAQLYGQQKIRGFCHLSIGQEAVIAGSFSAITKEDSVITAYRDHCYAMAKGVSSESVMAELYGKETGCSKGKGGSMHMFSKEHKFFGGHGIVGAQIPLGAGIALSEKYNKTKNVCLTFFGDGAVHQGAFGETLNMASIWKLPVIFICENNQYAMGTSVARSSAVVDIYKMGEAFNIPSKKVDGMKCDDVYKEVLNAVENARKGNGPRFIELKTYRYKGHSMSDPAKYRDKDEVELYKKSDPIDYAKEKIVKLKLADEKWFASVEAKIKEEVLNSVTFAESSKYPDESELFTDIYIQKDYPFAK
ncbi:MAG: pyruvate dehydrogenase (acetyl-transferring) E1 component subunit alpha [Solitalea-like symbiont of Acarus siro]